MAKLYKIRDWEKHYETAETRKLKRLQWVPVPNRHDGKGFRRLLRSQDGPLLFAGWMLVLQIASKCPIRGILADEDGPLTFDDLSDKTGLPAKIFEKTLNRLISQDIRWVEVSENGEESAGTAGEHPGTAAASPAEGRKEGRNIVGELQFERLWELYPNKDGKKEALRHFMATVKTEQDLNDIHKALANYKASKRVKDGFIKNGSTWFNNWRDWVEQVETKPDQTKGVAV